MPYAPDTFKGQVAIVTGGAGGIGQALSEALASYGAQVACLDRAESPKAHLSVPCDITSESDVAKAVGQVESRLGAPSLLVCAAGVVSEAPYAETTLTEWRRVVDVSLTGTFLATRAVVPGMAKRKQGSVVAFSSGYATNGYDKGGHYAAAKAGVEALVKSVAREFAPAGVRVNAVAPGPVFTPMLEHIDDLEAWKQDRQRRIPLGRIAEPKDMVGPVLFLLGPEAGYMTGQTLHVNGGLLMP